MKEFGKGLCIAMIIMFGFELMLVYCVHPLLLSFDQYAAVFILIIIETAIYKTLLCAASAMSIFYSIVLVECLYTKFMKRIGIEK